MCLSGLCTGEWRHTPPFRDGLGLLILGVLAQLLILPLSPLPNVQFGLQLCGHPKLIPNYHYLHKP